MARAVLIAHAEGEDSIAEKLAEPIRGAGYEVAHAGTVMVGESIVEEASKLIGQGCPVVLCGTVRAIGTGWAHKLANAATLRQTRVFAVQVERDAYIDQLGLDAKISRYWEDARRAAEELVQALQKYYPLDAESADFAAAQDAERRYRELALEACDIMDLVNLPEGDRHVATRQLELRRLYVGLRVRVQVPSGSETVEAAFEALEQRRLARQSQGGYRNGSPDDQAGPGEPVGRRLAEAQRLVVLGDPGAGKTTLIRWLATAYLLRLKQDPDWKDIPDVATLPDKDWLPIVIRCRDLDQSAAVVSLDAILGQTLRKAEMSDDEADALGRILRDKLAAGEAILLLDGLDEISDPGTRMRFCQQLEQIHVAFPRAPILATSRIVGYREMGGYRIGRGFEHVTVAELSSEDKDDFARRWCAVTEPPQRQEIAADELIQDIHSTDRIEQLTGNPMLLTTMALVKRKVGKLPSRRADLYRDAVEVLLNWRREVDEPIDHREALPQLQYVAYAMCDRGVQQLSEEEIVALLTQMRASYPNLHALSKHSPDEFLRLLERRTGILVESGLIRHEGWLQPVFEFRHLTFEEYLAGLALVSGRFPGYDRSMSVADRVAPLAGRTAAVQIPYSGIEDVAVSESWREALRLCLATCRDDEVEEVLLAILRPLPDEDATLTARPRAVLAALCLTDEPNVSGQAIEEVLTALVTYVTPGDVTGTPTGLYEVTTELARSRWAPELRRALASEFRRREGSSIRDVIFLGVHVAQESAPIQGQLDEWLCSQAAQLPVDDVDVIETAISIGALAPNVGPSVVSRLGSVMFPLLDRDTPVARAAGWALSSLNREVLEEKAWRPIPQEVERLLALVRDPRSDGILASLAALILGREETLAATDAILGLLENDIDIVRVTAANALESLRDARAVPALVNRLDDPSAEVRGSAAWALGRIGDTEAVEPLLARADDPDEQVRGALLQALGELGDSRAFDELLAALEEESTNVRWAAAAGLGALGDERAVDRLIRELDGAAAYSAMEAIARIGGHATVAKLEAALQATEGPWSMLTYRFARTLARIGDTEAVRALAAALDHPVDDVRRNAAEALGESDAPGAREILLERLNATDPALRSEARAGLITMVDDEIDRKLVTRDLDGLRPHLGDEPIDESWLTFVSESLDINEAEIRRRYEVLAPMVGLRLAWRPEPSDSPG